MAKFEQGQLIYHRRYAYRGVILQVDPFCRAPDAWYRRNRTQPPRDQPWYHVLVHGGDETYVAEENLAIDASGEQVAHPLVEAIFPIFLNGRYHLDSPN